MARNNWVALDFTTACLQIVANYANIIKKCISKYYCHFNLQTDMALQEELERHGNWLFKRRSNLPLIILVVGLYVHWHTETHPGVFILEDTCYEIYYETCCLIIALLGLALRIYTVGYTPANTSGRNTEQGQVADKLNTTGIYSAVRHPLYLGNFFM